MYSYQKNVARKRHESFVPQKSSTFQLKDNRSQSTIQRKLKNSTSSGKNVIQMVKHVTDRPSFTADSKKSAMLYHNVSGRYDFKINISKPGLDKLNAAQPHRLSWKDIRDNTMKHHNGVSSSGFNKLTKIFIDGGNSRIRRITRRLQSAIKYNKGAKRIAILKELLKRATNSQTKFEKALSNYTNNKNNTTLKAFFKQANSFHANVPDYGPHFGVNQPVSSAVHLNLRRSSRTKHRGNSKDRARSPSPMSRGIINNMRSRHLSSGIAVDKYGRIITTSGRTVKISTLSKKLRKRIAKLPKKQINSFDKDAKFG